MPLGSSMRPKMQKIAIVGQKQGIVDRLEQNAHPTEMGSCRMTKRNSWRQDQVQGLGSANAGQGLKARS